MRRWFAWATLVAGVFGIASYFFFPVEVCDFFTHICIMVIYAMSLNLLIGYSGMISFGQAAFFATGAYTLGILLQETTIPFLAVLIVSIIMSAIVALIIGYFSVRLGRLYFAMLTLAFAQIIYVIIIRWRGFTGGTEGLTGGLPGLAIGAFDLTIPSNFYIFTFILAFLSILICRTIVESPFGNVLKATRDNAERLNFIGVDILKSRRIVFVIAGALAGLAGALMGVYVRGAFPDFAYWTKSAEPIFMVLIGGLYNFYGPILGAVIFVLITTYVTLFTDLWMLILGGIIVVISVLGRGGILDYLTRFHWPKPASRLKWRF